MIIRKQKLFAWAAPVSSLAAVIGVMVNFWLSHLEYQRSRLAQVSQQAQLDKSWELLQGAVAELGESVRRSNERIVELRVALAEMRGALGELRSRRIERTLRGSTVDKMTGWGPTSIPETAEGILGGFGPQRDLLPADLPAPEPSEMKKAARKLEMEDMVQTHGR
jgi:hypothetical protein